MGVCCCYAIVRKCFNAIVGSGAHCPTRRHQVGRLICAQRRSANSCTVARLNSKKRPSKQSSGASSTNFASLGVSATRSEFPANAAEVDALQGVRSV